MKLSENFPETWTIYISNRKGALSTVNRWSLVPIQCQQVSPIWVLWRRKLYAVQNSSTVIQPAGNTALWGRPGASRATLQLDSCALPHAGLLTLLWSPPLCSGPPLSVPVCSGLCWSAPLCSRRRLQCFKTSLEVFPDPTAGALAVGSSGTSPVLALFSLGYNCLSSQLGQNLHEGRSYADCVISKALSTGIVPDLWWALNTYLMNTKLLLGVPTYTLMLKPRFEKPKAAPPWQGSPVG